jgi:DNA-binding transcriptional MerR regulator
MISIKSITFRYGASGDSMKETTKQKISQSVKDFRFPRYNEIPNVGFYLEQATKYVCEYLEPLGEYTLTPSMISNYVKKGLIENPTKKQYYRDQIAYLIFIAFAKSVLSLENIRMLVEMQKKTYGNQRAYDYFCEEFENILQFVFNLKETLDNVGNDVSDEKVMLRNTIVTISHKLYLDQCFVVLEKELREENEH